MANTSDSGRDENVQRGFKLPCLGCGKTGIVSVDLEEVNTVRCRECEWEADLADVETQIKRWAAAIKWLRTAPVFEED